MATAEAGARTSPPLANGRHGTDLCHTIRRTEEIGQGARAAAEPSPLRSAPNARQDS